LNWNNPVRRDTATLPAGGWLAIAFSSNNPGAWLMVSDCGVYARSSIKMALD
jgi:hypothetical protein